MPTFSYIDLIVILVLAFTTWYGSKRGFLISAYSFASYFLTYILTNILYKPFAKYLVTTNLYTKIDSSLYAKFDYSDEINTEVYNSASDFLKDLGLPDFLVDIISIDFDVYETLGMDSYRHLVASSLAEFFINIIAFISVFIAVILILKVIGMVLQVVKKLPVISQMDSTMGAIFGFLNGTVVVIIVFLLISAIFIYSMSNENVTAFNNSFFYNIFTGMDIFTGFRTFIEV